MKRETTPRTDVQTDRRDDRGDKRCKGTDETTGRQDSTIPLGADASRRRRRRRRSEGSNWFCKSYRAEVRTLLTQKLHLIVAEKAEKAPK